MAAVSMLMAVLIFSILQTIQTGKKIAACFGVSTLQLNPHLSLSCLEHCLARNSTAMPGFPLFSYLYYSSRLGPLGLQGPAIHKPLPCSVESHFMIAQSPHWHCSVIHRLWSFAGKSINHVHLEETQLLCL